MPEQHTPTDEEIAAALAAIHILFEDEMPQPEAASWHWSARLEVQNLRPFRLAVRPTWGNVERLRRQAPSDFSGVTGL